MGLSQVGPDVRHPQSSDRRGARQRSAGRPEDVELAVAAARRAFDSGDWVRMRPNAREKLLWRIAELMDQYADDLGELESLDNGKSVGIATVVDVRYAAECFRYYAGWPTKLTGTTNNPSMLLADPSQEFHAYTRREAVGVCAQIIPWNFPILMAASARRGRLLPGDRGHAPPHGD